MSRATTQVRVAEFTQQLRKDGHSDDHICFSMLMIAAMLHNDARRKGLTKEKWKRIAADVYQVIHRSPN